MVWGHKPFPQTILKSLSKLNRLAMVGLSPIRRSTPTAGLEVILGLKPLDLVIQEAGLLAFWRWLPKLSWPGWGGPRGERGHILSWSDRGALKGVRDSELNRNAFSYNWDPPCHFASADLARGLSLRCSIATKRDGNQTHFNIKYDGELESGGFPKQLMVAGQELNCLYMGLEFTLKALLPEVRHEMKVGILLPNLPFSVLKPLITDQVTLGLRNILREVHLSSGYKV